MWLPPCLLFVCMRRHTFCSLSLPFASYVSRCAGGGWARLSYASRSPFALVGVVAVLISCSLRSVAWHVTYLDPTSHVCMLCMFSFCLCGFLCVVLHLGGVWPPSCVLLSFVGFFVPPSCPFIPCCSSVAVMTLRLSGHVRAYLSFPMSAGVGIGIHSVSPLVGFPCRRGFRCAFRGGALWRCLARNFLPRIAFVTALCMAICATATCMAWHITYLFFGGRLALLLLVCVIHARHATYLCGFVFLLRSPSRVTASSYSLCERACIAWSYTCGISPPWCGSLHTCSLLIYLLPRCACFVGF